MPAQQAVKQSRPPISHPFPVPPDAGQMIQVAPGIQWLRLPLPLRLDHVNVYILDDGDSWTIIDTGYGDADTLALWPEILNGPLAAKPVGRVLVTHHHPDHLGAAGWLLAHSDARLWMSQIEHLHGHLRAAGVFNHHAEEELRFLIDHGLDPAVAEVAVRRGPLFQNAVEPFTADYRRISDGTQLTIGGRIWQVLTCGGHSYEQVVLFCATDNILLSADQLIDGITPNIPVWFTEPDARPVDEFLASLTRLAGLVNDQTLVLAGHKLPFIGAPARIEALIAHHAEVLAKISAAVAERPRPAAQLLDVLYRAGLPPNMAGLALAETLAHVNSLIHRGDLRTERSPDGQVTLYSGAR